MEKMKRKFKISLSANSLYLFAQFSKIEISENLVSKTSIKNSWAVSSTDPESREEGTGIFDSRCDVICRAKRERERERQSPGIEMKTRLGQASIKTFSPSAISNKVFIV